MTAGSDWTQNGLRSPLKWPMLWVPSLRADAEGASKSRDIEQPRDGHRVAILPPPSPDLRERTDHLAKDDDGLVEGIGWSDRPDTEKPIHIPIWSPKHLQPVRAIILSESVVGVYTHYIDGRTRPCMGTVRTCGGCAAGMSRRWKGYLGCIVPVNGKRVLVEVTTEAVRGCPMLLTSKVNLRGSTIELRRTAEAKNSPVRATIGSGRAGHELPETFDVRQQLCVIWGVMPLGNDKPAGIPGLFED